MGNFLEVPLQFCLEKTSVTDAGKGGFDAGCQNIGIYPYQEARSDHPRAVLGLNDISARVALKRMLKEDVMTFATPFSLFEEMEMNGVGSFLERGTWQQLMALKKKS